MSDVKDWIWFSKRQVPHFQNDTEPKLFPDEYVKYVPRFAYDELQSENAKLKAQLARAVEQRDYWFKLYSEDVGVNDDIITRQQMDAEEIEEAGK